MDYLPYDSRDERYKTPFGAVAVGQQTVISLLLHRDALVREAFLLIRRDGGEYESLRSAPAVHYDGDFYRYSFVFKSTSAGIYYYRFYYTSAYGDMQVTRQRFSKGTVSAEGGEWQLTCYAPQPEPQGFAGGLIYQIFPDRFFASGKKKTGVPTDRYINTNWGDEPAFRQDGSVPELGRDWFGGDLSGIEQRLDYIQGLGVSIIYLNPIFEAHSNHRYDTADYMKIDPLLGDKEDFTALCSAAERRGIKIIIDGVFSHTGADSRYFDLYGRYGSSGAAVSESSPYRKWYGFRSWPDSYDCWWGVPSLPETNENDPSFSEFITGENGVLRTWLRAGASGVRLDVADELPDEFIDKIYAAVKAEKPDALIIGEVWEDATDKISYGHRRRYLLGGQLDSVMNYPFARLILDFVTGGDAFVMLDGVATICENYPPQALGLLMNHIGTHDTVRVLTMLGNGGGLNASRAEQSGMRLSPEAYAQAVRLLKLAAVIQYTLPGIPSLYYGDEAGLQGGADPFCRGCYPWGSEDRELLEFYRELGSVRKSSDAFKGAFKPIFAGLGLAAYERRGKTERVLTAVNRWREGDVLALPEEWRGCRCLLGTPPTGDRLELPPFGFSILAQELPDIN